MDPLFENVSPIKDGDIPACYVSLPEGCTSNPGLKLDHAVCMKLLDPYGFSHSIWGIQTEINGVSWFP